MIREQIVSVLLGWTWISATLATAIFVLLGSWYPFEWAAAGRLDTALEQWIASTSWHPSKSDFAINLMLGVPLGFFGLLALVRINATDVFAADRGGRLRALAAVLVMFLVIVCGLIAELGQHWFGQRFPSAYDTLAQGIGGLLGIVCAWFGGDWFSQQVSSLIGGYGEAPFWALLDLYVAGYATWMLMPFVPCVSPSELKHKWTSGMIQLSIVAEWRTDVRQALYTAVITSISALPIGFWFARFLRGDWRSAIIGSAVFVVGLEVLQIVVETRYAQASDALWATVGVIAGVCLYRYLSKTENARRGTRGERYVFMCNLLAVVGMIGYLGVALSPFEWIANKAELVERVRQLRAEMFKGMLSGNDMMNASNLLRELFMSIGLGALFGCAVHLSRTLKRWFAMTVMAVLLTSICASAELLQVFSARHSPGVLAAAVRVVGGWMGLAMSVNIVQRSRQTHANE